MSSNGDPGGNSKGKGLTFVTTVCVVEMFTTEGINLSAKSAKELGIFCEKAVIVKFRLINIQNKTVLILNILIFRVINNYKTYYCKNKSSRSQLAIFHKF